MKKILAIIVAVMFGLGFASLGIGGVTLSKSSFRPGDTGTMTFSVSNVNTADVVNAVTVQITGPPGFSYDSTYQLGDMNPGTSSTIAVPITVSQNMSSGIYVFDVKAYGTVATQSQGNTNFIGATSVAVPVLNAPILSVSGYAGTYVEGNPLSFSIDNHGGLAKQMKISVLAPFAINGASQVFAGDVSNSSNVALDLNVVGVNEGQNTLGIALDYYDELGNQVKETKNISLNVKKQKIDLSFKQLSDIVSRREAPARFMVSNSGKTLKDVSITFLNDNITIVGGSEVKLGDIGSNQTKELDFTLDPMLSPGTQNINALITYVQDGKDQMKDTQITFNVGSDSDVRVFVEAKPTPVAAGQEETLSVTVANTWDYPIESTVVGISGDFFDLLSVQNEQYIGLLNKDDFSSVQFKVAVKPGASGANNMTVRVRYKEPSGNFVERDKVVAVSVGEAAASGNGSGVIPLAAGVVVLAAIVWWFFIRKKKAAA